MPAQQALVVLMDAHVARATPHQTGRKIETVPEHRPLTAVRTVLPVVGHARGGWVRVMLPGRPNGPQGLESQLSHAPVLDAVAPARRSLARRVTVYRDGAVERRFRAVIGAPATPTPRGRFFVEEALRLSDSASGGPFALATSARSNVLQEFEGGPGQIALHGTNHLVGAPGTAVSHGSSGSAPRRSRGWRSASAAAFPVTVTA